MTSFMNKKIFLTSLKNKFWIPLISCVLVVFLTNWGIEFKNKLKDEEKLGVFIASLSVNEEQYIQYLKGLNIEGIKKYSSYSISYDRYSFWDSFLASGTVNSDIFIGSEDFLDKASQYILPISDVCENLNATIYNNLGILAYDVQNDSGFLKDYLYNKPAENLYVAFNIETAHYSNNSEPNNINHIIEGMFNEET